jgi:hypothetical protein
MGSGLEYLFIGNGTGIQKMKINFSRPDPIPEWRLDKERMRAGPIFALA